MTESVRDWKLLKVLSFALLETVTQEDVVRALLQHAALLGAPAGVVHLVDDDTLVLETGWGLRPSTLADLEQHGLEPDAPPMQCLEGHRPVEADWHGHHWHVFPLRSRDELHGVLSLISDVPLPQLRVDFLQIVALDVGAALRRAELYEDSRQNAAMHQRISAILSHDLRTPISAILLTARLLEGLVPGELQEPVQALRRSGERASRLVESMLAISRGPDQDPSASMELEHSLREQVTELATVFPHATLEIHCEAPVTGSVDRTSFEQIVGNLVRNAIEHGRTGAPVQISLQQLGDRVELCVTNAGTPTDERVLESLFAPFARGRRDGDGIGLGLYIVAQLVERLGGSVQATCREGSTRFRVSLPLAGTPGPAPRR